MFTKRLQPALPHDRTKRRLFCDENLRIALAWKRIFLFFLALVCGVVPLLEVKAQTVGMTEQKVLEDYGKPQMEMKQGKRKIWRYGNDIKIVIENGKVVESNVSAYLDSQNKIEVKAEQRKEREQEQALQVAQKADAEDSQSSDDSNDQNTKDLGACFWIGFLILVICKFALLYVAFMESVPWAIACLLVPIATLAFVATHWKSTKYIFLCQVFVGIPLVIVGII